MELMYFFYLLLCAACVVFLYENYRSNTKLMKNEYRICSSRVPCRFDGKKIAFLSDLHNNELGTENQKIFDMLSEEKPDYVFVGGDMLIAKAGNKYEKAEAFMKELAKRYPVYCGNGNHEARLLWRAEENPESAEIYNNYMNMLKESGIHHLCDKTTAIYDRDEYILLSELELDCDYYKKFSFPKLELSYIEEKLGTCNHDSFHILLAHNPSFFEKYAQWGADLTLSGHVHGGIMRLPFFGGVIAPSYELFPKYDAGLFEIDEKKMIISVGLGSHSIRIRLFNPPKIDFITLKRTERQDT